jgi:hypothetical protein
MLPRQPWIKQKWLTLIVSLLLLSLLLSSSSPPKDDKTLFSLLTALKEVQNWISTGYIIQSQCNDESNHSYLIRWPLWVFWNCYKTVLPNFYGGRLPSTGLPRLILVWIQGQLVTNPLLHSLHLESTQWWRQ